MRVARTRPTPVKNTGRIENLTNKGKGRPKGAKNHATLEAKAITRPAPPRRLPSNGTRTRAAKAKGSAFAGLPDDFTPAQYEFAITYLANGFNASAAAKAAYPDASDGSARAMGYENLTKRHIRTWLLAQLEDRWKGLHMTGDEALARVAGNARSDIRMLFNAEGALLKPHEWPDEIAYSVESVDLASGKVKLVSKTHAQRTILEVTSKVRGESSVDQLVEAMKATIERNQEKATKK